MADFLQQVHGQIVRRYIEMPDGTHAERIAAVIVDANGNPGVPGGSGAAGGGGIIGVDTAGTKWLMVVDTSATPATITYYKIPEGTTGTPVGSFAADSDQNSLTLAQLQSLALATEAKQDAGNNTLGFINARLAGVLSVSDAINNDNAVTTVKVNGVARSVDASKTQEFTYADGTKERIFFDANGDFAGTSTRV